MIFFNLNGDESPVLDFCIRRNDDREKTKKNGFHIFSSDFVLLQRKENVWGCSVFKSGLGIDPVCRKTGSVCDKSY